jgi:hypothetical protein
MTCATPTPALRADPPHKDDRLKASRKDHFWGWGSGGNRPLRAKAFFRLSARLFKFI